PPAAQRTRRGGLITPEAMTLNCRPCRSDGLYLANCVPPAFAQADRGGQLDRALLLRRGAAFWGARGGDGEDEAALTEAHPVDQDRGLGIGQGHNVTDIAVAAQ